MKKFLIAVVALVTLVLCVPLQSSRPRVYSPAELTQLAKRSMVTVDFPIGDDKSNQCAAFVVDSARGWALTARHCVDPETIVIVAGNESSIVTTDEQFALITIAPMSKPPLTLAAQEAGLGDAVQAIGYGYGWFTTFYRHVAARSKGDFAMDNPLAPGMSGGPVLNEQGEVVGLDQASNGIVGIACGVGELRDFLGKAMKGKR